MALAYETNDRETPLLSWVLVKLHVRFHGFILFCCLKLLAAITFLATFSFNKILKMGVKTNSHHKAHFIYLYYGGTGGRIDTTETGNHNTSRRK